MTNASAKHGFRPQEGIPENADRIPAVFPAIDNDLAVENIQNDFDMTGADRQDLEK